MSLVYPFIDVRNVIGAAHAANSQPDSWFINTANERLLRAFAATTAAPKSHIIFRFISISRPEGLIL